MRKRRRRPLSDINVVPYLDVMLVLLVIFMITAPLFNQGVVSLPEVGDSSLPQQKIALEVVYHPSGANRFQLIDHERNTESDLLNEDELMQQLGDEKLLHPGAPITVVISADGALEYKDVIALLGELQDNEFSVGLNVRNRAP